MVQAPSSVAIITTQLLFTAIAAAIIGARLWLRVKIQSRSLWASDVLMMLAWLSSLPIDAIDIVWFRKGALEPDVDNFLRHFKGSPDDVTLILELFWAANIPFYTTFYLCKAALLATFLQLFPCFMVCRRIALWTIIVFTAICFTVSICFHIFGCQPVQRNWSIGADACPPEFLRTSFTLGWSLHFISDLCVFVLPWLILHQLQLKRAVRVGVYCTFLLGTINLSVCIVRFVTVIGASEDNAVPLSVVVFWNGLDSKTSLIIACLPSLRPYLHSRKTIMEPSDPSPRNGGGSSKRSVPGLPQRGFEPIDEPGMNRPPSPAELGSSLAGVRGVMRTTAIHVHVEPRTAWTLEEPWEHDPREKSEVELVDMKKATSTKSNV